MPRTKEPLFAVVTPADRAFQNDAFPRQLEHLAAAFVNDAFHASAHAVNLPTVGHHFLAEKETAIPVPLVQSLQNFPVWFDLNKLSGLQVFLRARCFVQLSRAIGIRSAAAPSLEAVVGPKLRAIADPQLERL